MKLITKVSIISTLIISTHFVTHFVKKSCFTLYLTFFEMNLITKFIMIKTLFKTVKKQKCLI